MTGHETGATPDLRQVLDEAGGYLDGAKIIASRVQVMELTTANLTDTEDELPSIIASLLRALTRLRIRLGRDDPTTAAFADAAHALGRMHRDIWGSLEDAGERVEIGGTLQDHAVEFEEAILAFYVAAVQRAGTITTKTK